MEWIVEQPDWNVAEQNYGLLNVNYSWTHIYWKFSGKNLLKLSSQFNQSMNKKKINSNLHHEKLHA